jgi:hypothetical protein
MNTHENYYSVLSEDEQTEQEQEQDQESFPTRYKCPICFELLCDPVSTSCGHVCCRNCFIQCLDINQIHRESLFRCPAGCQSMISSKVPSINVLLRDLIDDQYNELIQIRRSSVLLTTQQQDFPTNSAFNLESIENDEGVIMLREIIHRKNICFTSTVITFLFSLSVLCCIKMFFSPLHVTATYHDIYYISIFGILIAILPPRIQTECLLYYYLLIWHIFISPFVYFNPVIVSIIISVLWRSIVLFPYVFTAIFTIVFKVSGSLFWMKCILLTGFLSIMFLCPFCFLLSIINDINTVIYKLQSYTSLNFLNLINYGMILLVVAVIITTPQLFVLLLGIVILSMVTIVGTINTFVPDIMIT